jgi:hypothetical protein
MMPRRYLRGLGELHMRRRSGAHRVQSAKCNRASWELFFRAASQGKDCGIKGRLLGDRGRCLPDARASSVLREWFARG